MATFQRSWRIEHLADHPDLIRELAALHHAEWGHMRPDRSLDARTERLRKACGRGGVPTVVVALDDGGLLGSAMLIANDMETRPDLTPWLAGVFVLPAHRGRGLGAALVARIEGEAAAAGAAHLYLYTPGARAFYERLGWRAIEETDHLGHRVTIMSVRPRA